MSRTILLATTLFGPNSTASDNRGGVLAIILAVVIFGGLGWLILKLLRLSSGATRRSQANLVKRVVAATPAKPGEPMVTFRFTTYTGFGVWMNQTVSEYRFPASQAKPALDRLLKHNLTRGLMGPGLVFVPFLSLLEYWTQSRNIARQNARGFMVETRVR